MDSAFAQLGIGGILVLLVLKEVLPWVARSKKPATAGEQGVDFWKEFFYKLNAESPQAKLMDVRMENLIKSGEEHTRLLRDCRDILRDIRKNGTTI